MPRRRRVKISAQKNAATIAATITTGTYAPRCRWKPPPVGLVGGGAAAVTEGVGVGFATARAVTGIVIIGVSGSLLVTLMLTFRGVASAGLNVMFRLIGSPGFSTFGSTLGTPVSLKKLASVVVGSSASIWI